MVAALTWGRQTSAQAADVPIAYTYDIDNSLIYKFNTKDRTLVGDPISTAKYGRDIAVTRDGKYAVVFLPVDRTVVRYDVKTGKQAGDPLKVGKVRGMVISSDDSTLYAAGFSNQITRIDLNAWTVGTPIGGLASTGDMRLAISPDGNRLYLTYTFRHLIEAFDTKTGAKVTQPVDLKDELGRPVVTPDGKYLYVPMTRAGTVLVLDAATDQPVGKPISACDGPAYITLNTDGSRGYVSCSSGDAIAIVDTQKAARIGDPIKVTRDPLGSALTPDGKQLWIAHGFGHAVSVVDTTTNTIDGAPIDFPKSRAMVGISIR
ncbi:YncE family protein [Kitasatospora sp. NPDC127121]|uniref:YncE family protein n=1 Tax=Kitasatospora sp. NPDC127121 TaxID=3345371 RepID=UPI0036405C31